MAMFRFTFFEVLPKCIPAGIVFMSSCADERPPTGGKRDSIPPKLKLAEPANKTLNFKSERVKLHFNEFLQQTLDPKEIVISPPLDKKPKITVDGKTVTISIKAKLKDSTTYTINFGDAIKDINEGNILKNFSYVFSTGPILDTASVSGSVSNISSPSEVDNLIVSLYPVDSLNGITYSKPFYFAKTDRTGAFTINNIHAGKYNVYALKDQNLNYEYDLADELIGFSDSTLSLNDSSKTKVSLGVFLSVNNRPKFTDALCLYPGKISIAYNSPIKSIKVNANPAPERSLLEINDKKDSILYWYSNIYDKKIKLNITINDTINDTTTIDTKYLNRDSINNDKKYALYVESQINRGDSSSKKGFFKPILSPFKPIKLILSRPVERIHENKWVYITNDSTLKKDSTLLILDSLSKRSFSVTYPLQEKIPYTLMIPDSSFTDIFGWWNKKQTYKWIADASDNYGDIILKLKIDDTEKHYVFKILDQDNHALETLQLIGISTKTITFKNIKTGLYHLQAVDDTNNNGQWDTGDFSKKVQPEKIINFKESYEVKGNWELEIDVKF